MNGYKAPAPSGQCGKNYNVLMVAPTSFFASYGCHVRILEEARVLQKMGHRVTIVTYHNGQDVPGLHIERTISIPWRRDYEVGSSRHKIAFDVLLTIKCGTLTGLKPDIIHAHLHEGVFVSYPWSLFWGVPLIFDFQGSMTAEMVDHHFLNPKGPFYRPARWLESMLNRLPQAIITSTHHAAALLANDFAIDPSRITPIPDCVVADEFTPAWRESGRAELKASLGIPADRQVVVYLGLLAAYQGTDLLLQAAQQVVATRPDVHFLVMGYPSVEQYRLQAQALGLDGHVTFTGRIPYEDAPRYLSLGDVAVAPKISATEGAGKLLNYMAMALPTVAFDNTVSREYLGADGIYAPQGDVAGLAHALLAALDEREDAARRGEALRRRAVERFSWDWAGQQIVSIYERVLAQPR